MYTSIRLPKKFLKSKIQFAMIHCAGNIVDPDPSERDENDCDIPTDKLYSSEVSLLNITINIVQSPMVMILTLAHNDGEAEMKQAA